MNLFCVVFVLAASGAAAASLALRAALRPLLRRLRHFTPNVRVRWVMLQLSAPIVCAALVVMLAFGPCLHSFFAGLPDDCHTHGGPDFFFCFRMKMPHVPAAWLATGVLAAILGRRLFEHARATLRARAALGQLRSLGHYDRELQLWLVPGDLAIVAGWPRSEVYVGTRLRGVFSPDTFAALLAHERAHQRRADMGIHLAAQMLGSCLPGFIRTPLLGELDLAIEQACDALAAAEIRDPLAVARSLLDAARTGLGSGDGLALAFCAVKDHLEARVRALCEPRWLPSRRPAAALVVVAVLVLGACITFDPRLRDLSEALFGRLLG